MHRYSPTAGLPALRDAIVAKTGRDSGLEVDPAHVTVSNGGKHGLFNVFQALVDPATRSCCPRRTGSATLSRSPRRRDRRAAAHDGRRRLPRHRGPVGGGAHPATKALVFVSPSNPTGSVCTPDEIREIGRWAAAAGVWLVTDEIYEHLVYEGAQFASMPMVAPEITPRCGRQRRRQDLRDDRWRVGWSIAPPAVAAAINRVQSHVTSNVSSVAQRVALAAVEEPMSRIEAMRDAYDQRRRIVHEAFSGSTTSCAPCRGGAFYVFPDVRARLQRPVHGRTVTRSLELCNLLLDEIRVALVPGEAFGAPGHVRLSCALSDEELRKGLTRIIDVLQ